VKSDKRVTSFKKIKFEIRSTKHETNSSHLTIDYISLSPRGERVRVRGGIIDLFTPHLSPLPSRGEEEGLISSI
jgi:hypothetical protein